MKVFSENKKAEFNYTILEKFEAGIVLQGGEVKSIKEGKISLSNSYIDFKNNEVFLIGSKIAPYQPHNPSAEFKKDRERKLLLHKKQINYLIGKSQQKGMTIIPLKIYERGGKIKVEIALAKGKKKFDKKEKIKNRDRIREIREELEKWG